MTKRAKRNKRWWLIIPALAVLAGGGYYYYTTTMQQGQASSEAQLNTTTAKSGDLTISATAAGTVIATAETSLGFATEGEILELYVEEGDVVEVGDELGSIDDLVARQELASAQKALIAAQAELTEAQEALNKLQDPTSADVLSAQAAVETAQENLSDLLAGASAAELASAQAAVATAQEAYDELLAKPTEDDLYEAQVTLDKAKNSLWSAQLSRDAQNVSSTAYDSANISVLNAEMSVEEAERAYAEAQEPATEVEIAEAYASLLQAQEQLADLTGGATSAEITSAQANLASAQETLDSYTSDNATAISLAEANVNQAELAVEAAELTVESAESNLENTTLTATMNGTITDVSADVGDVVETTDVVFTITDLEDPYIEIYIDETDVDMLQVGYEAEVVFDALPDDIFTGAVSKVDPVMIEEAGYSVIRAVVTLDPESFAKPQGLMVGMNATVDVIGGRTEDAVLIAVEALRDLGDGQYGVFVIEDGEPVLRSVTVGLQDYTYAEITSGLKVGDVVSTGITEVAQ